MSIKIYNGMRAKQMSFAEFQEFYHVLQEKLKVEYINQYIQRLCEVSSATIYKLCELDEEFKKTGDSSAIEQVLRNLYEECVVSIGRYAENRYGEIPKKEKELSLEELIKKFDDYSNMMIGLMGTYIKNKCSLIKVTDIRNDAYHFYSQLVTYSIDGHTLLLPYGAMFTTMLERLLKSRKKENKEFVKKYELEEYEYWNNCDRPKTVTKKNWEKRLQDWNIAFHGDWCPASSGCLIDMIDTQLFFENIIFDLRKYRKDIKKGLQTKEDASIASAINKVKSDFYEAYLMKHKGSTKGNEDYSSYSKANKEFDNLFRQKDAELMKQIKKAKEEYLAIYPTLSIDSLCETPLYYLPNFMNSRK